MSLEAENVALRGDVEALQRRVRELEAVLKAAEAQDPPASANLARALAELEVQE